MTRRFGALMDGGFPYLVAVLDGRVVGYAYAGAYRPRPAYRFTVENSVYLQPAIHRRGIGLQLLQRLIAECEARGYRQMIAVIGDSANAGSIGVHTRTGFQMIGTHPDVGFKFGRWLDTVMMQLALGDGGEHGAGGSTVRPRCVVSAFPTVEAGAPRDARRDGCLLRYGRIRCWLHHRQLAVDHQQHAVEFVAAAQDQPGRRDHAVDALLARQPRIFFDSVDRNFGGAAEHREHRAVSEKIDGVVAPLAVGDHAPVQIQNAIEFETIERHPARQRSRSGIPRRCAILAWIGYPPTSNSWSASSVISD